MPASDRTVSDLLERLDGVVALVGLGLGIALLPLQFVTTQIFLTTVPLVLLAASGIYLYVAQWGDATASLRNWRVGTLSSSVLRTLVVVGLTAMVVVGRATGGRTVAFYVVAAIVGTLVFVQIFFLQESVLSPPAVLAQILAFTLLIRAVALTMTPSLIGVDAWVHLPDYARSIYRTGELTAISDVKYFAAPLYHLFVVAAAQVLGTSLQTALYVTFGVVVPLAALFLYAAVSYFVPVRWALFATAAFSVSDHFVRWGIHIIPTSIGLVFFVAIFYGVTKIYVSRTSLGLYGLVVFFGIATVFTHQISTFILLTFLGAGVLSQLYVRFTDSKGTAENYVGTHVNFAGLFAIIAPITALNWHFTPGFRRSFLGGMVATAQTEIGATGFLELDSVSTVETDAVAALTTSTPTWVQFVNVLGFLSLLFLTIIGLFTLLQRRNRQLLSLSVFTSTGAMLLVVLGMPILGLYFLIPGRWYAFLYVPMIVAAAYGLHYLEFSLPVRKLVAMLVLFAVVFPGAMLVDKKATHDNPVADDHYQRFAFSGTELTAANDIAEIHPESAILRTDQPYNVYLRDAKGLSAEPLRLHGNGTFTGERVLYRTYQSTGAPKVTYRDETIKVDLTRDRVCRPSMDVVYMNQDTRYCLESS